MASDERARVRKYLEGLPLKEALALTPKLYRSKTRHVGCTDGIFSSEKYRLKKKKPTPKPRVEVAIPVPFGEGKLVNILATVDLEEFNEVNVDMLKKFAKAILGQCYDQDKIEAVLLSHPPTLELRRV